MASSDQPPDDTWLKAEDIPVLGKEYSDITRDTAIDNADALNGNEALSRASGWRFWFVIAVLSLVGFASGFDATIIFTALPTIVNRIGGQEQYVWIANAYLLASVVIQPLIGQLCNIFGRKWPFLAVVALFAIGGGVAGGASSPAMLIAGRTIQGLGCGGLWTLIDLIICDLTTQRERGKYLGIVLAISGIGTTVGPLFGGALVAAAWRWVFYITLPFSALAFGTSIFFLRLRHERNVDWAQALRRIDVVGNVLFITSITSVCIGLISGGAIYPWGSYRVVIPLTLGFIGWACFHVYEASPICREPVIPRRLFSNRTAFAGFLIVFIFSTLINWLTYILPLYFQAIKRSSPLMSSVETLPFIAMLMPAGIIGGGLMSKSGKFIPIHAVGFALCALGTGLLSTMDSSTKVVEWFFWQFFAGLGVGTFLPTILPAIQASLPESEVASSTATFSFLRSFGTVWGVVIPSVILNSEIDRRVQAAASPILSAVMGQGRAYGSATGNALTDLTPYLYAQAIDIYTQSIKIVWYAALAFSLLGFLIVFAEKHYELKTELGADFGLEESGGADKNNKSDV